MSIYRSFSSAMKTSSSRRRSPSSGYTDQDYERKREENLKQMNSQHSREMNNVMRGRR